MNDVVINLFLVLVVCLSVVCVGVVSGEFIGGEVLLPVEDNPSSHTSSCTIIVLVNNLGVLKT